MPNGAKSISLGLERQRTTLGGRTGIQSTLKGVERLSDAMQPFQVDDFFWQVS